LRAILTYHSIDSSGSPISVDPPTFRAHVRFLGSGRVRVLSLDELVLAGDSEDAVALTFDDAYLNVATVAAPLLRDHDLPATVFVVTDRVGGTNSWSRPGESGVPELPLMGWDVIGRVREAGIAIGSHTRNHCDLTRIDGQELQDEIAGSADRLSAALGRRPDAFAYPFGAVSTDAVQAVRSNYSAGCTTELRFLRTADDAAVLPRLDVYYFRGAGQLEAWGSTIFRRRVWLRAQGRRVRHLAARVGVRP
jgi:peptidoglycan/xylan/chitin deacetylase (PgdA/CDA1 family)